MVDIEDVTDLELEIVVGEFCSLGCGPNGKSELESRLLLAGKLGQFFFELFKYVGEVCVNEVGVDSLT